MRVAGWGGETPTLQLYAQPQPLVRRRAGACMRAHPLPTLRPPPSPSWRPSLTKKPRPPLAESLPRVLPQAQAGVSRPVWQAAGVVATPLPYISGPAPPRRAAAVASGGVVLHTRGRGGAPAAAAPPPPPAARGRRGSIGGGGATPLLQLPRAAPPPVPERPGGSPNAPTLAGMTRAEILSANATVLVARLLSEASQLASRVAEDAPQHLHSVRQVDDMVQEVRE
jgi:hypothetical protein